jgi:hypothetical protein
MIRIDPLDLRRYLRTHPAARGDNPSNGGDQTSQP